jgi:AraC-like DNA-binding protein
MKSRHENLPIIFPTNVRHFINHRSGGRSHWHEEIELQYVVDGGAHPLCNLQPKELKKGDILFVNSNELHAGNVAPLNVEFYCFHINKEFFSNHIGNEHVVFNNVIRDTECAALLDEVIRLSHTDDFKARIAISRVMYEFFELCAERHTTAVLGEGDFKKHFKRLDKFNDMVKFIEEHSAEPLTVTSVAEKFFVTPSYFAHFFKKKSGKSVIQYLNEVRILKARLLLEQEDIAVSEIALQVGFDDINYFSRKFKQIVGQTPTDYKREYKK